MRSVRCTMYSGSRSDLPRQSVAKADVRMYARTYAFRLPAGEEGNFAPAGPNLQLSTSWMLRFKPARSVAKFHKSHSINPESFRGSDVTVTCYLSNPGRG